MKSFVKIEEIKKSELNKIKAGNGPEGCHGENAYPDGLGGAPPKNVNIYPEGLGGAPPKYTKDLKGPDGRVGQVG